MFAEIPAGLDRIVSTCSVEHNKPALQDCASIESTRISFFTDFPHAKYIDMPIDGLCGPSWNVYHREPPTLCHTDPLWCRGAYTHAVFDPVFGRQEDSRTPLRCTAWSSFSRTKLTSGELFRRLLQSKRQTYAAGYVSLLPRGLSPSNYALSVAALPSRLLEDPDPQTICSLPSGFLLVTAELRSSTSVSGGGASFVNLSELCPQLKGAFTKRPSLHWIPQGQRCSKKHCNQRELPSRQQL